MKYRPNLWSTVEFIQTAPDTRRCQFPFGDDMRKTVYIPDVHFKKDRELKNAYRL